MVNIALGKHHLAVSVNEVPGVQQVVLRPIEGIEMHAKCVAGGALMGDGTVALVIDMERLIQEWIHASEASLAGV